MSKSIFARIITVLVFFNSNLVSAEEYPLGACILDDGKWCLPANQSAPGETCQCYTGTGWETGIQN